MVAYSQKKSIAQQVDAKTFDRQLAFQRVQKTKVVHLDFDRNGRTAHQVDGHHLDQLIELQDTPEVGEKVHDQDLFGKCELTCVCSAVLLMQTVTKKVNNPNQ